MEIPYTWGDLRERHLADLDVGAVIVKPAAFSAYWSGGPNGGVRPAIGLSLEGHVWTVIARDGDQHTVQRQDKAFTETISANLANPRQVALVVTLPPERRNDHETGVHRAGTRQPGPTCW